MNTGGAAPSAVKVGMEQSASATTAGAKPQPVANTVNERTYQEVEYLKKNLGPILVAALAEICIRRPADPIEYLGHWLLRWRYNEELKRRDVQNALDVVRQRQWAQVQEETAAVKVEKYADGFTPDQPHGPPGYGGPLSGEELGENGQKEVEEAEFHPPEEITGEGAEIQGEGGPLPSHHPSQSQHLVGGPPEDFSRKSLKTVQVQRQSVDEGQGPKKSLGQPQPPEEGERRASLAKEGERRTSLAKEGERRTSLAKEGVPPAPGTQVAPSQSKAQPPAPGERKTSLQPGQKMEGERRASEAEKEKRASMSGAPPPVLPSVPAVTAPSGVAPPAPAPDGERRASLEPGQPPAGGQPRKNSKAEEGHKASISSAPVTDGGSVGGEPPGGRKLSDASKQPPGGRKVSDASKQPPPPAE